MAGANAKRGTGYNPYAVCNASIGYEGSYRKRSRRRSQEADLHEVQSEVQKRFGIENFEFAHPGDAIKTIGYSPRHAKWFGWSHRAVAGFGVGSTVKKGDVIAGERFPVGSSARTLLQAKQMAAEFADQVS